MSIKLEVQAIVTTTHRVSTHVLLLTSPALPTGALTLPGGALRGEGLVDTVIRSISDASELRLEPGRLRVDRIEDSPHPNGRPITVVYSAFLPDEYIERNMIIHQPLKHGSPPGFYPLSGLDQLNLSDRDRQAIKDTVRAPANSPVRSLTED